MKRFLISLSFMLLSAQPLAGSSLDNKNSIKAKRAELSQAKKDHPANKMIRKALKEEIKRIEEQANKAGKLEAGSELSDKTPSGREEPKSEDKSQTETAGLNPESQKTYLNITDKKNESAKKTDEKEIKPQTESDHLKEEIKLSVSKESLKKLKSFLRKTQNDIASFFIKNKKPSQLEKNLSKEKPALEEAKVFSAKSTLEEGAAPTAGLRDTEAKKSSINVESSLLFEHNLLFKGGGMSSVIIPYENWSVSIPYTEISLNHSLTEKLLFEIEAELSYKNRLLGLKLDSLFLKYSEESFFVPFSFQWGKFRMESMQSNSHLFHKKTLTQQSLFPYGNRALGVSLEAHITDFLSVLAGWQTYQKERESDSFYWRRPSSALSSYLLYRTGQQNVFAGYLQQELFLEGFLSAYGAGADLNHSYKGWFFKFKTELWKIKRTEPETDIFSYYLFPYLKWKFVGAGFLIGSSGESLSNNRAQQFENIIKFDLYFTKSSYFSIERLKEYSSIYTKDSLTFAIKSDFSL